MWDPVIFAACEPKSLLKLLWIYLSFIAWLFPVHSAGLWIQGLLPRLPGGESRWSEVDVAGQRCQRAERNAAVDAPVSNLRPGQAYGSIQIL